MLPSNEYCGKSESLIKTMCGAGTDCSAEEYFNGAAKKLIKSILENLVVRDIKIPLLFRRLFQVLLYLECQALSQLLTHPMKLLLYLH